MKTIIALLSVVLAATVFGTEDAAKPALTMPAEVTLTTGRVLRGVTVIRWESNRVVLKHSAGADPIPFTLFKKPAPDELPAIKVSSLQLLKAAEAEKKKAIAAAEAPKKYDGQIFIVTRGAGNYKMGGIVVRIYYRPVSEMREIFKWGSTVPQSDGIATTDADGKFSFEAPAVGPLTLVAKGSRQVGANTTYDKEKYLWIVGLEDMADRFTPLLNNANMEQGPIMQSRAYESL
jgi:hypothetical protein